LSQSLIEHYYIPAQTLVVEEEIKHSRFISLMFHCPTPEAMKQQLMQAKLDYPGANHYCYAFVAGAPGNNVDMGSSDDGEPAGSAGRPMLASLQGADVGEIGIVIIRFFGGTKLGVGGLVRAYSSGVKLALKALTTDIKLIRHPGNLTCSYEQLNGVEHLIYKYQGVIIDRQFGERILIEFALALSCQQALVLELAAISQGRLVAEFTV
jgi:uncharacterized YigZ family protein